GIATATESAAVGCVAAIVIAALIGRPALHVYYDAVINSVKVSAAILLIACAAYIFAYAVETTGTANLLAEWVIGLDLDRYIFLLALFVMFALLGCLVDSIGMIVLT